MKDTELAAQMAKVIYDARERLNWTQKDLARATGVSQHEVSRAESGQHVTGLEKVVRLLGAMGHHVSLHVTRGPLAKDYRLI